MRIKLVLSILFCRKNKSKKIENLKLMKKILIYQLIINNLLTNNNIKYIKSWRERERDTLISISLNL